MAAISRCGCTGRKVIPRHCGGHVIGSVAGYDHLCRFLCNRLGAVLASVDYRLAPEHKFPTAAEDAIAAWQWFRAQAPSFGADPTRLGVMGDSAGGNLAIATTLKAKQEGWLEQVDGVYALCPYISGAYGAPPPNLLSLEENDGYSLDCQQMAALVKLYDPDNVHAPNPLAWPYHAPAADIEGLPPHFISVNELDPLRDEGIEYYRKLVKAGNSAVARTVHGTNHAGDMSFPDVTPDLYESTLRSLVGFAGSLVG